MANESLAMLEPFLKPERAGMLLSRKRPIPPDGFGPHYLWRQGAWHPTQVGQLRGYQCSGADALQKLPKHKHYIRTRTFRITKYPYHAESWLERGVQSWDIGYPELAAGDFTKARLLAAEARRHDTPLGAAAFLNFAYNFLILQHGGKYKNPLQFLRVDIYEILQNLGITALRSLCRVIRLADDVRNGLIVTQEAKQKYPGVPAFGNMHKELGEVAEANVGKPEFQRQDSGEIEAIESYYEVCYPWDEPRAISGRSVDRKKTFEYQDRYFILCEANAYIRLLPKLEWLFIGQIPMEVVDGDDVDQGFWTSPRNALLDSPDADFAQDDLDDSMDQEMLEREYNEDPDSNVMDYDLWEWQIRHGRGPFARSNEEAVQSFNEEATEHLNEEALQHPEDDAGMTEASDDDNPRSEASGAPDTHEPDQEASTIIDVPVADAETRPEAEEDTSDEARSDWEDVPDDYRRAVPLSLERDECWTLLRRMFGPGGGD